MRKALLITNLPSCSEFDLRELFREYGKVRWGYINTGKNFRVGKYERWGVVQMKHSHDADRAIECLNGFVWRGQKLNVKAR
jgi:RNA recognition motif-containing protein